MLNEEDGEPHLAADFQDELLQGLRLLGVHARGGLVQEEELGLEGEGAGDLQLPLLAVGEVAGELVLAVQEAHVLQEAQGLLQGLSLLLSGEGGAEEGVQVGDAGVDVPPHQDVLQDGHGPEEADVLEGAPDAELGRLVGVEPVMSWPRKRIRPSSGV